MRSWTNKFDGWQCPTSYRDIQSKYPKEAIWETLVDVAESPSVITIFLLCHYNTDTTVPIVVVFSNIKNYITQYLNYKEVFYYTTA